MTTALLGSGSAGAVLFVVVFPIDGWTRPRYRPVRHPSVRWPSDRGDGCRRPTLTRFRTRHQLHYWAGMPVFMSFPVAAAAAAAPVRRGGDDPVQVPCAVGLGASTAGGATGCSRRPGGAGQPGRSPTRRWVSRRADTAAVGRLLNEFERQR